MRRLLLMSAMVAVVASTVYAQEDAPNAFRRFEINYNAISFVRTDYSEITNFRNDRLSGWGGQVGLTVKIHPRVGIVGDFAMHRSSRVELKVRALSYRGGPRFYSNHGKRVTSFGHFLVGGGQVRDTTTLFGFTFADSVKGLSIAAGGGIDIGITPWLGIRAAEVDYDYFRFDGGSVDGFRVGGGVIFRMGGKS